MNPTATSPSATSRREFLKTSSTAAVAGALAPALSLGLSSRGFAANSETLRVGLVGCGGRGGGAAVNALKADSNVMLTAMGDVFESQAQGTLRALRNDHSEKVQVPKENIFVGLDAYQKVIDSGVDVVILATPPGFRPLHFKAAVAAGKQIFIEKPMATDAAGFRSVLETVQESKRKKLAVVAGFCWRYDYARRELFQRVHDGEVGDVRAMHATYYTGPVKPMPPESQRRPEWTDLEWQLRNWYNFVWLCGDSLVEQAVHSVDKIVWAMGDVPPVKAVAVGGRQIPANGGNIFDHFEVNYEFPNGVWAFMASRQQSGCYNQTADYIMGATGTATIGVRPMPEIIGPNKWRYSGKRNDMYQTEHDELFASIRAGNPINDGERMALSTMVGIMGRMAAYTGQEVTWEQAIESKEDLYPRDLAWNTSLEVPPLAMPGRSPLV